MKKKSTFCETIFAKSAHSLTKLRMQHGPAGLGIYLCIIEALFDEPDALLPRDYETIAFRFGFDAEQIRSVIEDYGLFCFSDDGASFFCELLSEQRRPKPKRSKPENTAANSQEAKPDETEILLPQVYPDPTVQSLPPLTYNQKVALEIQRFMSLSLKEQTDLLRNDQEWVHYTAGNYRVTSHTLLDYINKYQESCEKYNDIHYNCADLKYRFCVWCNDYTRSQNEDY